MKNKKIFMAVAGALGVAGAIFGVKKLQQKLREEELIREADLFEHHDDEAETCAPSDCESCGCGCACGYEEPTENIADISDIEIENEVSDEVFEEINSEKREL